MLSGEALAALVLLVSLPVARRMMTWTAIVAVAASASVTLTSTSRSAEQKTTGERENETWADEANRQ